MVLYGPKNRTIISLRIPAPCIVLKVIMKKIFSRSFIDGFVRSLDLFAVQKKDIDVSDGFQKDRRALEGDWQKVGETIWAQIRKEESCDGRKTR